MRPIVIINYKTYKQGTGEHAVKLAKVCEQVAKEHGIDMRIAVQATDIALVSRAVDIPVYAQHVDPLDPGKTTGWLTAHAIKAAGASGCLLNHSEHRMSTADITAATARLAKEHMEAIVCAENLQRLHELSHVDATLFVIEPPELIAGEVSVSVARPDIVASAVHATRKPLLIGAGVKEYNDMVIAQEMGARGALLSSHVLLAKDHRRALLKLLTRRGQ
jgi:triosephosphate isomerase